MTRMRWFRKIFFFFSYLFDSARWDTGVTPPEVEEFLSEHPPGRALDLGCGTGTNLIALARAGWEAVGVDFIRRAVLTAREKIRREGVSARVVHDDVSTLNKVSGTFDLVLDIGCFHSLDDDQREGYTQRLFSLLAPGGTFLLYAFQRDPGEGSPGITREELDRRFGYLQLVHRETGTDGPNRKSAWHWYENQAGPRS